MGNFIGGIFRTAGRLIATIGVMMAVYLIGQVFFENTTQDISLFAMGVAMPGIVYTVNGIFFDVLNWSILDNGFFRFIKKAVFYILWIGMAGMQILGGESMLSMEADGLVGGLTSTMLFSSVIGVFYSLAGTLDDDFEGTWVLPIKMGGMALLAGVVLGILGGLIPFLGENYSWILPVLSNGGLLAFMIVKGVWPYSNSIDARDAMMDATYGSSGEYSGGGYSSYDDDYDDEPQDYRKEGGWGQLGDAMWAVAKKYDGNSYTLAYGEMRLSVYQTTTGWNTLLYEVTVIIRPGYTCTDEYAVNQLRNDAESKIREVQQDILSDAQDALRGAQAEYKAYDKNYKIEVRIVDTRVES